MSNKHFITASFLLCICPIQAQKQPEQVPTDTLKVMDIEEVVVIASPKETGKLRTLPTAVSLISQKDMQANQVTSMKRASALVPNFFMPDYGSRITSAMYIRGIGSRINTPAVGMYVDNIPYFDKSAFDFNFYDIERVDILRGPQGTLYGRNTMGGLVKVHTRSPFSYQGTDIKLGYGSKNNHRTASISRYHRWCENFAFSGSVYYEGADGFFTNHFNQKKVDDMEAGGGRLRAIWLPNNRWKLDFNVSYDYNDEGSYPYYYTGVVNGPEPNENLIGQINYNRESGYRRSMLNTGVNIRYEGEDFTMNAITGYQHLNDRMVMDQDFSPMDIYTIEQKQRIHTISEEVTFQSKPRKRWQWTTGVSGFYQTLRTQSPVIFRKDGMRMLGGMLGQVIPCKIEVPMGSDMAMRILPALRVKDHEMNIDGLFNTPQYNLALFHQSTLHNLFQIEGLAATIGMRLDYENMDLKYNTGTLLHYSVGIQGEMIRKGQVIKQIDMMPEKTLAVESRYKKKLNKDYVQLLPKFALQYDFIGKQGNVYLSACKGYRSGGYNIQMFSELLQSSLRNDMMRQSKAEILLQVPDRFKGMVEKMFPNAGKNPDAKNAVEYKPEYTWSYEAGTHLNLFDNLLQMDAALFWLETKDQQISRFAASGLGRETVNAGKSRSMGAELGMVAQLTKALSVNANYGYTYAIFRNYVFGGTSEVKDYNGNYVPFVPKHTLNIGGNYCFEIKDSWIKDITIGGNYTGAGRIYWTEQNNVSQAYYQTLNSHVTFSLKNFDVDVWGRNLFNNDYTTFYFESMNRGFKQQCKPLQIGVDIHYHF